MTGKNKLSNAVIIVMVSTLLSRIVGFVREMLLPNMLASRIATDAYNNAFIMPDLMYSLLLGGAISAAMIPVLSGYIDTDNEKEGWFAVSNFMNTVFILMVILCILGTVFSKELMYILISGQDKEETRMLAAGISRILFSSIAFLMLSGLLNGVLNSYRKFAAAALGPIIYNIGSALSIYFLSRYGVEMIAYGVLASSVIYFLTVFIFSYKYLKYYKPVITYRNRSANKLFRLAFPSFLSASVVQLNIIVSLKFANLFAEGRVTAFKLADRIWQMPYGIIAVSMGIALLPTLSGLYAKKEAGRFADLINTSFKYILTVILPCSIGFLVLNKKIVMTVIKFSKNLSATDVNVISGILLIFSVALITQSMIAILNRIFYSIQDTKVPFYSGAATIVINLGLSYLFYKTSDLDINGIALAYSISSLANMVILLAILKHKVREISFLPLVKFFVKLLPPLIGMTVVIFFMDRYITFEDKGISVVSKITQLGLLGSTALAGAIVYFTLIIVFRVPEGIGIYNKICIKLNLKRLVINVN
jgi:putative peptidoglycan lipid II flippase